MSARRATPPRGARPPPHRVGHRLVPGDQPGQAVGPVLGLHDHVDGGPRRRHRVVGHHDHLGRAGEGGRHADHALRRHLPLGHGDVDVAGADDHVDRPDRLGAVGHGRHRLGAADPVHLVDAGDGGRGQGRARHPPVGPGRHAQHHLGDAGHPGRDGGHEHGRRVAGPAPGHVGSRPGRPAGAAPGRRPRCARGGPRAGPGGGGRPRPSRPAASSAARRAAGWRRGRRRARTPAPAARRARPRRSAR